MADTQVKLTSPPSYSDEHLKKHLLKIFKDVTKDCEDKQLRKLFDTIVDYDALNTQAMYMFSAVVDCGSLDEARELFKPLPGQVTLPEVAVFTMVIVAYTCARKTMDAHKVYQQMIASGVTPTAYTYTALISGFAQDMSNLDSVRYAKKYFLEMLDRGMKPTYGSYMCIMAAIAYQEPVEEANKFLEQIKDKGFIPENAVLQNNRDVLTKALQDGNDIEAIMFASPIQRTLTEPSVLFHTIVIEAYLKFGKIKGALEAYVAMLLAGVAPNSYTYTVLIKGLAADPEFFGDAKMYLLEMMDKGKRPNVLPTLR
ncbi:hypothetical protein ACLB2K_045996 [Fragaria x ananassa]